MPPARDDFPPPDLIPKNLSDALVAIGRLQVTCQNQEVKLGEQDSRIETQDSKLADLIKFQTQISMGWKVLAFLGTATAALIAAIGDIKGWFGK